MDELIKKLTETADISEDVAKKVVGVVSEFMQEKLPAGIGDKVTGVLGGGLDGVGNIAERAGEFAKDLGKTLGGSGD